MAAKVKPLAVGNFKRVRGASAAGPILAVAVLAYSTITLAQNIDRVKAGLALWKTAGCADCHGPFADGRLATPPERSRAFSRCMTMADR